MPLSGTGQCLVPVLPRRAKTLFPGRGPLRCAPWSFLPGRQKLAGPVSAPPAPCLWPLWSAPQFACASATVGSAFHHQSRRLRPLVSQEAAALSTSIQVRRYRRPGIELRNHESGMPTLTPRSAPYSIDTIRPANGVSHVLFPAVIRRLPLTTAPIAGELAVRSNAPEEIE